LFSRLYFEKVYFLYFLLLNIKYNYSVMPIYHTKHYWWRVHYRLLRNENITTFYCSIEFWLHILCVDLQFILFTFFFYSKFKDIKSYSSLYVIVDLSYMNSHCALNRKFYLSFLVKSTLSSNLCFIITYKIFIHSKFVNRKNHNKNWF